MGGPWRLAGKGWHQKKAKHPGTKTADWTVKKEGRKGRIEARGENGKGKAGNDRETPPSKKKGELSKTKHQERVFLPFLVKI